MAKRKSYDECIKGNNLIQTIPDKNKTEELLKLVEHRKKFWKEIEKKSNKYPSLFIEGHYEIIKELFTAIISLDGWKALNHECLFAYIIANYKDKIEIDFEFLLELKDTRNSIDYRGIMLGKDKWDNIKMKMDITINALIDYVKEMINENKRG